MSEQAHLEAYRHDLISSVRDVGQQRALWDRDWADAALEHLERLAADGRDFTADDLVAEVGKPDSPNAIGALFGKSSRTGLIRCVGYRTSSRVARHGGIQRIWRGREHDA